MCKNGLIGFSEVDVYRDPFLNFAYKKMNDLILNDEQSKVMDDLKSYIDQNLFRETFLFGVTGSGKTEIYLQIIKYVISKNKTAIVLVPEISLTPQMVERFKSRFSDQVAVLHSRLSLGERYDQWVLIKNNKIKVVVGARSAIFAPINNLGIVILMKNMKVHTSQI